MVATLDAKVPDIREEAVVFGPEENLVGVLTRPAEPGAALPAVICLNAGVIHRVGPHRMHVLLGRRLAARGFHAFRLDLSGIGDSRALSGTTAFRERAVADARAAMDMLAERVGAQRFVLFGLCSGADNGVAAALADERVVGLVLLDPYTYVTRRAQARKLLARVRKLGAVRPVLTWAAHKAAERLRTRLRSLSGPEDLPEPTGRDVLPAEVFGGVLETLLGRGVGILAIYSGALEARYNHPDQLFEVFPRLRGRVDRIFFSEANHMFTERAALAELLRTVGEWLERRFR
jgi:dienelactone hydrolase